MHQCDDSAFPQVKRRGYTWQLAFLSIRPLHHTGPYSGGPFPATDHALPPTDKLAYLFINKFSSVQSLSRVWLCNPMNQHTRPPCPSPTAGVHPNPCPLSRWCHPTISFSVGPFSSCPQFFPASGSFQMSQLFTSGGQSIRVSALTSVLPVNIQDWSPLGWTGWISLQSKGLSRVFSYTTVQKHQFFCTQLSSKYSSHIYTWPLEKP